LTLGQSAEQWKHDVVTAKEVGIDGFALNIGPSDPWTKEQLDMAYRVTEEVGDFVLFISFEYEHVYHELCLSFLRPDR
jgi:glucan endo-1,3-alpha-glucosidase